METSKSTQILSIAAALTFALVATTAAYRTIGLPPVVIVGGSSLIGLLIWSRTYLKKPVDPRVILPPFLLTVAALQLHMGEELFTGFAPAISRLFDVSWSEHSFLLAFMVVGPALYTLTALGLFYRVPLAGFMAWFIFIGPGFAEFTHFIFPLLQPALHADVREPISQAVSNGRVITDMRNYWLGATGSYYFPGMYTAVLPMIPGIWAIVRTLRAHRAQASAVSSRGAVAAFAGS
jgi:hypothetical protein